MEGPEWLAAKRQLARRGVDKGGMKIRNNSLPIASPLPSRPPAATVTTDQPAKAAAHRFDSGVDRLKNKQDSMPESEGRLDNFGIQELMSRYNQAETLASSVAKKQDDASNSIIGKI